MSAVANKLDSIIEGMEKEGMKAAIAQGIISRIREIVEESTRIESLIKCLGANRGRCTERFCDPACARIFMIQNGETHIGKVRSNAVGITISSDHVKIATKEASLQVNTDGTLIASLPGGLTETIDLAKLDEVYRKNHMIKLVVRKVGRKVDSLLVNLQACARASAIVC